MFIYYPPRGQNLAPKHLFTPIFCLPTVTTGSGDMPFGYLLLPFHVFTEIYPLIPSHLQYATLLVRTAVLLAVP